MTASTGTATVVPRGDLEIIIERDFDAPAHNVFRAWTEPDLIRRWWSGRRGEMTDCQVDLRVGGKWRNAMIASGSGQEIGFNGVYLEIVPGEKLVFTETFEMFPDGHTVNTLVLTETDGVTHMHIVIEHPDPATREMQLNSGMEIGMNEGMDLLERLAIELP